MNLQKIKELESLKEELKNMAQNMKNYLMKEHTII